MGLMGNFGCGVRFIANFVRKIKGNQALPKHQLKYLEATRTYCNFFDPIWIE